MKIAIIYKSISGNTKEIAEAIYSILNQEEMVYYGEAKENIDAELYVVGSWTDKGMCDQVINDFLSTLHNKKIAYFGTAGFGGSKEYYDSLWNRIKNNIDVSNTLFKPYFCQGKMPVSVRNRYVDLIHKHPDDKKLQVSIDNFDKALTHPDQKDKENAKKWILDIIKAQE